MEYFKIALATITILIFFYLLCRLGAYAVFKSWFQIKKQVKNNKGE